LAKLVAANRHAASSNLDQTATLFADLSAPGSATGTPGYIVAGTGPAAMNWMHAPIYLPQASCLYEMATGKMAFKRHRRRSS
jgi:hypothetical protein